MTTITLHRALAESWLNTLCYAKRSMGYDSILEHAILAIRAELAKPVEPIPTGMAVERLCQALHDDLDYAWSWHCNVAMSAYDAGCPHDVANEGAARFMQLLAGVDTRQHFAFSGTQAKPDRHFEGLKMRLTPENLERARQWFDAVHDINHEYLTEEDYVLARDIYKALQIRVPTSIERKLRPQNLAYLDGAA